MLLKERLRSLVQGSSAIANGMIQTLAFNIAAKYRVNSELLSLGKAAHSAVLFVRKLIPLGIVAVTCSWMQA